MLYRAKCIRKTEYTDEQELVLITKLRTAPTRDCFAATVQVLSKTNHPGILSLREAFILETDNGEDYFYVWEGDDGVLLSKRLAEREKPLSTPDILGIYSNISEGLDYLNRNAGSALVLTPSEVLLIKPGQAKIIPSSIAACPTEIAGDMLNYAAPEFAKQRGNRPLPVDTASSIYSFGVCLYKTITGRLPFQPIGSGPDATERFHFRFGQNAHRPQIDFNQPELLISEGLKPLLGVCLDLDRDQRIKNYKQITKSLQDLLGRETDSPRKRKSPPSVPDEAKLKKQSPAPSIATTTSSHPTVASIIKSHPRGLPWRYAAHVLSRLIELARKRKSRYIPGPKQILVDPDWHVSFAKPAKRPPQPFRDPYQEDNPSQAGGIDELSLIYTLGIYVYYVLTGRVPKWSSNEPAQPTKAPNTDFSLGQLNILDHATQFITDCIRPRSQRTTLVRSLDRLSDRFDRIEQRTLRLPDHAVAYRFEVFIKKGGFGRVIAATAQKRSTARPRRKHPRVAIKELINTKGATRFQNEASILKTHPHDNIVEYLDYIPQNTVAGESKGPYLIMELLDNMPEAGLDHRIHSQKGIPLIEALELFTYYLDALTHLHSKKIYHRDIKPGNLFAPQGQPHQGKLFDLGIALVNSDRKPKKSQRTITQTPVYAPPEIILGESHGSATADLYSLGISLYQAITGNLPFPRLPKNDPEAAADQALAKQGQKLLPDFSPQIFAQNENLEELLSKALAANPRDRFSSAKTMRTALQEILTSPNNDTDTPTTTSILKGNRAAWQRS